MCILTTIFIFDPGLANVRGDKAAENLMIYVGTEGTWYVRGSLTHANTNHASQPEYRLFNLSLSLSPLLLQCRTPAHFDQCGAIGHNIMAWAGDGTEKGLLMNIRRLYIRS